MESLTTLFNDYFVYFIKSTLAEGYILLLTLGVIFLLIGMFFVVVTLVPIVFSSPSIKGVVAGAVKPNIKFTSVDQKVATKKGSLFPVFEYTDNDGSSSLIRGSSGGSHVYKYKTGQSVNLIIDGGFLFPEKGTAIDKDNLTGLYWGGTFIGVGVIFMYWALSVLSSLSLGSVTLIMIAISFVIAQVSKFKNKVKKEEKIFDLDEMKPVEEFARPNKKGRAN